jgi:1,2-phenylacetyl-CoA epoxidase catalytic subunit
VISSKSSFIEQQKSKSTTNQKIKERKNNQFIQDWLEKNNTEEKIASAGLTK